ncbi:MAG: AMP-binding protein, partial [Congregibacter sp.]|nr:AMP-binding protein [Congregibacter sp.]
MLTESFARGPAEPAVRELTIGDALREAAADSPQQTALIAGTPDPANRQSWTFAQLLDEAERTAKALLESFEPGDRVAVWAPNIPQWVIMEYGCALAGVVLVTVNPSYQADELAYVLRQSKAAGIFMVSEFRGNAMLAHLEAVRGQCPELKKVVLFSQWQAFLDTAADKPLPRVLPGDACMIQYTSGTTGFPKGALLHHRGLVNNGAHSQAIMGAAPNLTYMGIMPLFHTGGCVLAVLGALAQRSALVLVEAFDPGLVLELMEEYRAAGMMGVPTMLIAMIQHPTFPERDLSSIKALCSGGSTVPAELVRRLEDTLGAPFTIVFGQTECSPVACMTRPDDSIEDKAYSLGRPMPGVEVKIIDPETGKTQPVEVLGEFCTRGYHVMHEYFENPEATAKTIDAEGWLHTGDLCSM